MKLVASMIVKNEFDRYLKQSIEHLLTYCDEVRVLDDGSTDGGFEWLGGLNKPVFVKKNPGPSFFEHEGRARQALLEYTMTAKPDFVLSIDADEFVSDGFSLRQMITTRPQDSIFTLNMVEVWNAYPMTLDLRVDGLWGPRKCPILWRAPSQLGGNWRMIDRALACGREPIAVIETRQKTGTDVQILHFGWACKADREERAHRYEVHDAGQFHNNHHLQSILWPDGKVRCSSVSWPYSLQRVKNALLERANRS